jgi:hypothetical protein
MYPVPRLGCDLPSSEFAPYYMFSTLAGKGNMNYFDVLGGNSLFSAKHEFVRHLSARMTSTDWLEKGINTQIFPGS